MCKWYLPGHFAFFLSFSVFFERAHLSAEALAGLWQGLWCHEGWRPGRAGQQSVVALELVAHSEVCDLQVAVVAQQQVGRLDVPVDDLLVMHWEKQKEMDKKKKKKNWFHMHLTEIVIAEVKPLLRPQSCIWIWWNRLHLGLKVKCISNPSNFTAVCG